MRSLATIRRLFGAVAIMWLNVCLLFAAANLAAALLLVLLPTPNAVPAPAAHIGAALQEVFPNLKDEEFLEFVRENAHGFVYEPFTEFRERPSAGKFVNVDANGFRHSRNQGPWPPAAGAFNVFVFGGSTAFGLGVPDDETIASHLQTLLGPTRNGREIRVYNFGRGAYYSSQERALFERLIVAGHVPDLAIFIDGLNDFFFVEGDRPALTPVLEQLMEQTVPAPVGLGVALRSDRRALAYTTLINELPVIKLMVRRQWTAAPRNVMLWQPGSEHGRPPTYGDPAVIEWVIKRYVANRVLIDAAASAVGVRAVFVWQPVPLYKYDLRYHRYQGSFGRYEHLRLGYPRMAEYVQSHPLGANFLWCADIQADLHELLYVDQVHYSPKMSARVAACIADQLHQRGLGP